MTGKYLKNNKAKKSKNIPKNTLNEGYAKTQNMQQTETKEEMEAMIRDKILKELEDEQRK